MHPSRRSTGVSHCHPPWVAVSAHAVAMPASASLAAAEVELVLPAWGSALPEHGYGRRSGGEPGIRADRIPDKGLGHLVLDISVHLHGGFRNWIQSPIQWQKYHCIRRPGASGTEINFSLAWNCHVHAVRILPAKIPCAYIEALRLDLTDCSRRIIVPLELLLRNELDQYRGEEVLPGSSRRIASLQPVHPATTPPILLKGAKRQTAESITNPTYGTKQGTRHCRRLAVQPHYASAIRAPPQSAVLRGGKSQ